MSQEELKENLNPAEARKRLFSVLWHIIETSEAKFDCTKARNSNRQSWGRLIVQAIQTYGRLLDGAQLGDLEKRVQQLEEDL